jgi:hypothetical protein
MSSSFSFLFFSFSPSAPPTTQRCTHPGASSPLRHRPSSLIHSATGPTPPLCRSASRLRGGGGAPRSPTLAVSLPTLCRRLVATRSLRPPLQRPPCGEGVGVQRRGRSYYHEPPPMSSASSRHAYLVLHTGGLLVAEEQGCDGGAGVVVVTSRLIASRSGSRFPRALASWSCHPPQLRLPPLLPLLEATARFLQ